jgi:hypothetical protein
MFSSDQADMGKLTGQLSKQFSVRARFLLVACLVLPSLPNAAEPSSAKVADSCNGINSSGGTATTEEIQTIRALRSAVESGPLYVIPAAAGVAACTVSVDEGAIILEYRFRNGGRLTVKRDLRIEYTEQVAQLHLARDKNPVAVLADAERAAFGASGCGIDWNAPDTKAAEDGSRTTQTLYYGDVCNCRAGIRRDAAKRVIELMLRSVC